MRAPERVQRHYDLDALRAWAMFLGIMLHAGIFVLPAPEWRWPMHDPAASGDHTYKLVIDAIHGFRMPVFFLLSGFFSALLWQRRGIRAFRRQRLQRVGIPLLAGCLTIIPATVWLLKLIANQRNAITDVYDQLTPLATPFVFVAHMGHLWFLWYLLIIAFVFIGAAKAGLAFRSPWWWLLVPVSALSTLFMHEPLTFGSDTATGLVPKPAVLFHYACFFFFGVHFHQRGIRVRRWWTAALLPAIPLFAAGVWLIEIYRSANVERIAAAKAQGAVVSEYLVADPNTLVGAIVEIAFAWLMCFALMGLFRWLFAAAGRTTERVAQYLSDAAYWMYLAHLPFVVAGQWLVLDLPISHHLKYLLVVAGVTALVLATYQWGVRYTFIGRALNGPRRRRGGGGEQAG